MQRLIIEVSKDETYTSHSGVALVGMAVNRFTQLVPALAKAAPLQKTGRITDFKTSQERSTEALALESGERA